jgi:hypothetical protein
MSHVSSRQASLLTMSAKDETTSLLRPEYVPLGKEALQKLSKDNFGFTQAEWHKKTPCTRQTKAIYSPWTFSSGLESGLLQLGLGMAIHAYAIPVVMSP